MTHNPPAGTEGTELPQEQSVLDYLTRHPDLLERNPDVLAKLDLVHNSGGAISLVERQLKILRGENQELKDKINELVHIARENEELSQRFHRLSLELMTINNLHDSISMIRDQIQTFFYTDYVNFFFSDRWSEQLDGLEKHVLKPDDPNAAKVRGWMQARKPVFGPLEPGLRKLLLSGAMQMPSCVLIPLYHTEDIGLLILGSKSGDRFVDGMGTLFLTQLGDLVSSKIRHFLN